MYPPASSLPSSPLPSPSSAWCSSSSATVPTPSWTYSISRTTILFWIKATSRGSSATATSGPPLLHPQEVLRESFLVCVLFDSGGQGQLGAPSALQINSLQQRHISSKLLLFPVPIYTQSPTSQPPPRPSHIADPPTPIVPLSPHPRNHHTKANIALPTPAAPPPSMTSSKNFNTSSSMRPKSFVVIGFLFALRIRLHSTLWLFQLSA